MSEHKLVYSEYGSAHDKALVLQRHGAVSIYISSQDGIHTLTWVEMSQP